MGTTLVDIVPGVQIGTMSIEFERKYYPKRWEQVEYELFKALKDNDRHT